ncbi:MAG: tetratricopeptide repeat protein, partial [Thermoguttaceae bacterium]|nr:tetratricopeptide repeat protein [Thermoguttaceae bacterium]
GKINVAIEGAKSVALTTADLARSLLDRAVLGSFSRRVSSNSRRLSFVVLSLIIVVGVLAPFGCRHVPFYRMTKKASKSLPLSREGIAAYERGDLETAEEKLAQAVELNSSDMETCRYYGETLWKRGKRVEAMDVLREAADKHGPIDVQTSIYRSLGEKALTVERSDQTILWANKIIDLSPKSSVGWELRGKAERELGRPENALADFQRAVHFETDDRSLLLEIATLQHEIGDYDAALATWQYLELLYPTNREPVEVFAGKGRSYSALGLLADAQEAYETAVRFAPRDPEYRVRLAEIALARKDYRRASQIVAEAQAVMPDNLALQKLGQAANREIAEVAETPTDEKRLR